MEVVNLQQLQKLVLGQLMIETVQQLKWLIKDSFKGKACGVVGALTAGTAEATSVATGDSV